MKKLLLILVAQFICHISYSQIGVYKPYRTNGNVMVGDSALFVGKLKIPSFSSFSLGGYADKPGQSFGLNLSNNRLNVRGNSVTLDYYSTTEVNALISSAGAAQTLSLGTTSGNIAISGSGGNNVSLASLFVAPTSAYPNANTLPTSSGLFPYNITTGSTNYPFSIGAGLKILRSSSSGVGYFEIGISITADSTVYIRKGLTASTFSPWMSIASRYALTTGLAAKQASLVSGTNIKTVNGSTLLGPGDIVTGSVTSINSANSDLSIVNPTTVPVLTVNTGSGANQIARRDSDGNLHSNGLLIAEGSAQDEPIGGSAFQINNTNNALTTGKSVRIQLGAGGDMVFKTFTGPGDGTGTWTDRFRILNANGLLNYATDLHSLYTSRTVVDKGYVDGEVALKQSILVSGINIKTVNGVSLLGTGNITSGAYSLADFYANSGNIGTSETDVYTVSVPANRLAANGDKIEAEFGGTHASVASVVLQVRVKFGSTFPYASPVFNTTAGGFWNLKVLFIRTGTTTARCTATWVPSGSGSGLVPYTTSIDLTGLDFTISNNFSLALTGGANSDIVAKIGTVGFKPAAL